MRWQALRVRRGRSRLVRMSFEQTDEALMVSYSQGDAVAFAELYERHRGGLYRFVRRQIASQALADELYQDIWMKLVAARQSYAPKAKFTTFLYRLARNHLTDFYRGQARRAGMSLVSDASPDSVIDGKTPTPDQSLVREQTVQRIGAILAEMPEAQRSVFLMRQEAGLTINEIASAMDEGMETVKSRLRYALAKLRAGLDGDHE